VVAVNNEPWGVRLREPWREVPLARGVLSWLAGTASGAVTPSGLYPLADPGSRRFWAGWLADHDFAALGFAATHPSDPEFAAALKEAALGETAGNLAHFATLAKIEQRFAGDRLPMVLLKGAAVASSAYRDPSFRPMTDLDIWVRDDDMPRAVDHLRELGFRQEAGRPDRPAELQRQAGGELVFRHGRRAHGLVELHFGAFQGWWIRRAATPDEGGVWQRAVPVGPGRHALRLAADDAILQTAFHVAVNQFGQAPLRGMMDLAVLARTHTIAWGDIARRARAWRLATATWLVLDTAHRLIGLPGCEAALAELRPARARRAALRAQLTPSALLAGRDLTPPARRHLFMLSLVDRPRDGARLVGRTVWPEPWWIAARYGRPVSRARHLWGLVRRGAA